ncbi:MAG: biotin/lipoate A/B protein ligase family protein [Mangrovibacterium sp.]
MTTRCYYINILDPYFNLATEEYLLKNTEDDIFMLWRGESSIVVGKHQNALAEINHAYVEEQGLKVARRLSGGGTVFHDPGNINFTFIRHVEHIDKLNYAQFLDDVKAVLADLGLTISNSMRDDLMLDGFKISGNAQHVHKNRVLHHGTLLFDSELRRLKNALKVDLSRFEHKAVQSNRSVVANIRPYLKKDMTIPDFFDYLFTSISNRMPHPKVFSLSENDKAQIAKLCAEKYSQWDWIYGYSPKYFYRNQFQSKPLAVQLTVQRGRVVSATWEGVSEDFASLLNDALLDCRHEWCEVDWALRPFESLWRSNGYKLSEVMQLLF